ncbi:MAG: DNA mismatch repair protein MutS [Spirochaetota bacterium]
MPDKLTPMFRQYLEIKKKHASEILFFRMGDFYEMFFDDAVTASRILDIALTKRQNDVPMCGVPYHAADSYITRLLKAGHRVAICEQLESAPSKGSSIVKRDVVRIMTPGTIVESHMLDSDDNNFLASAVVGKERISCAFLDVSTGDFFVSDSPRSLDLFRGIIARYAPSEIIFRCGDTEEDVPYRDFISQAGIPQNSISSWLYDTEYLEKTIRTTYEIATLEGIDLSSEIRILAAGSILEYVRDTHRKAVRHLKLPRIVSTASNMILDESTIENLELVTNSFDRTRKKTLLSVLDRTRCAMGKRLLELFILQPLTNIDQIEHRLDCVQYLHEYSDLRERLSGHLSHIHDIERLVSRFSIGRVTPRDFLNLAETISHCMEIATLLAHHTESALYETVSDIPDLSSLAKKIASVICDEPALTPEQGRIVREGANSELDRLYTLKTDARSWIIQYQEEEKKRLCIPTLKIKYNRVHGYYIEISKSYTARADKAYMRKQTLVNAERYTTEKLQTFETEILSASETIVDIEKKEIAALTESVIAFRGDLQSISGAVAFIDTVTSLAQCAIESSYVRPRFSPDGVTEIRDGRHPVVEKYFTRESFIPNDVYFDGREHSLKIITGPNMSGKSTYMRMSALIQLMGQIGSYVPASSAQLTVADRIFTRIGASDNIARGESTFLVEMNETATILNNATDRSMIIMDEIGRGTSTYDGLSLAYAIAEYIARYIRARTLFSTHYHELTELESVPGIINYTVQVQENPHGVEFLHKVVRGKADRSYGIHVAKLAGIPREITQSAQEILTRLEKNRDKAGTRRSGQRQSGDEVTLFNAANHVVIKAIQSIEPDTITPIEALNEIHRLKKLIDSDVISR